MKTVAGNLTTWAPQQRKAMRTWATCKRRWRAGEWMKFLRKRRARWNRTRREKLCSGGGPGVSRRSTSDELGMSKRKSFLVSSSSCVYRLDLNFGWAFTPSSPPSFVETVVGVCDVAQEYFCILCEWARDGGWGMCVRCLQMKAHFSPSID